MSTSTMVLAGIPEGDRARELWMQHAAGLIIFEDIRGYALRNLDPTLPDIAREAAVKAINDTIYGLMMVADGVTGGLSNLQHQITIGLVATLSRRSESSVIKQLALSDGDGMCMGYHGWLDGDFGGRPVIEADIST